ncbi:MAG: site-specific DNA-methyltransferase [Acidobacteriaceae bacterium]|jgi:site-specific DNA-methyltransferase (adenine-specific)|nr:site-specific DNA-methyltransferase [Acidobacteriaceae bacterium]
MAILSTPHKIVAGRRGSHGTFFLGDCLDILKQLPAGSIDVIVTSPPYNLGIRYNSYDDTLSQEDYLAWTSTWIAAAARVLRPDGSLFLNVGTRPSDPWTALDVAQAARPHLRLQNLIHWIKSIAIDKNSAGASAGLERDLAVGHYKPINSDRYLNDCHEFVFHFTPGGTTRLDRLALGVPYQDPSNIARWRSAGDGVRCRGNTWFIPYETIQRRDRDRPHPATFPSKLPEQCLRLHGLSRIDTVMDPFTGLGSTAVACARLGLNFIGSELDAAYIAEAEERMEATVQTGRLPGRGVARMRKATSVPPQRVRQASGA